MTKDKVFCTKMTAFIISSFTCLIASSLLVAFLVYFVSPKLVNGVDGSSAKAMPDFCFSTVCGMEIISTEDSDFLTLKEAWGFQASLYQTVITFLIAINGLIAALSVLYIKTNSEDKAESSAKEYVKSENFKALVEKFLTKKNKVKIRQLQQDYENAVENLDLKIERVNALENKVERFESENLDLKRQVKIISRKLAELDMQDSEGGELLISKEDK